MHGSRWVEDTKTVELIHENRHRLPGLFTRGDRIEDDEITIIDGVPVTNPARTVLDLGCWYPLASGVAAIDSLARATEIKAADVELLAHRYPGRRGIARARNAIGLFDAGAQSPKETWLRLVLVNAGLPRPQTQIPVLNEFGSPIAYLDMGWEDLKVAVEYDGEQHRTDRWQYTWGVGWLEVLQRLGWTLVRVLAGTDPRILFDGSRMPSPTEREPSLTLYRDYEASFTLDVKPLSRDELHPGEHGGVVAGWRNDVGQ